MQKLQKVLTRKAENKEDTLLHLYTCTYTEMSRPHKELHSKAQDKKRRLREEHLRVVGRRNMS